MNQSIVRPDPKPAVFVAKQRGNQTWRPTSAGRIPLPKSHTVKSEKPFVGPNPQVTSPALRDRVDVTSQISVIDFPCAVPELINLPIRIECGCVWTKHYGESDARQYHDARFCNVWPFREGMDQQRGSSLF